MTSRQAGGITQQPNARTALKARTQHTTYAQRQQLRILLTADCAQQNQKSEKQQKYFFIFLFFLFFTFFFKSFIFLSWGRKS
jgi:uracil-DNA glycosylase